jgi:hypothetical protein
VQASSVAGKSRIEANTGCVLKNEHPRARSFGRATPFTLPAIVKSTGFGHIADHESIAPVASYRGQPLRSNGDASTVLR